MPPTGLVDLPEEMLDRILDELAGSDIPNPFSSLILTSKAFWEAAMPRLYESITIGSRRQLESLVDKRASGAWKLPSAIRIKHLCFQIVSLDLFEVFTNHEGHCSIHPVIRTLSELVNASTTGHLETLSINIKPMNSFLPVGDETMEVDEYLYKYFSPSFLAIRARSIECTHADALLNDSRHSLSVPLFCLVIKHMLSANTRVQELRLPCLDLRTGIHHLISDLSRAPRTITKLHLDWPIGLRIQTLMDLLLGLGETLEERGLVIACPFTHLSQNHTPDYVLQQFYVQNPGLRSARCMSTLQDVLATKGADVEASMSKLDWRIP